MTLQDGGSFVIDPKCLRVAPTFLMEISDAWQLGKTTLNLPGEKTDLVRAERERTNLRTKCCPAPCHAGSQGHSMWGSVTYGFQRPIDPSFTTYSNLQVTPELLDFHSITKDLFEVYRAA